jgi:hypothetical protein
MVAASVDAESFPRRRLVFGGGCRLRPGERVEAPQNDGSWRNLPRSIHIRGPAGIKAQTVCIVSSPDFNRGADVIVAMVTSSRRRFDVPTTGDVVLDDWQEAGLLRPSVVRAGRLLVVEVPLLSARLGALSSRDLLAVDSGLKEALGLT